ncbi:hypothetical protein Tco_0215687 [Tanacetum coccineum]
MMTTFAENMIVVRVDNRPPMLEKSMYKSWQGHMKLYIRGKEHGKDLLDSVLHGPFQYGKIEVDGFTRARTYEERTDKEKFREECEIWDKVKLLMEGTELSLPECESICVSQQLSTIAQQFFTTQQQPQSHKELVHQQAYHSPAIYQTFVIPQQAYQAPAVQQQPHAVFPQLDSGLVVPSFLPDEDLIASLNKAMTFISTIISLRYPTTNNQLRTSSNIRNQLTIQDGRVIVQQVQGRQSQSFEGHELQSNATNLGVIVQQVIEMMVLMQLIRQGLSVVTTVETDDLDAFDSDYDEALSARAVLMLSQSCEVNDDGGWE